MCLKKKNLVLLLAGVLLNSYFVTAQIATGTVVVNNTTIAGATYTTPPVTQGAGGTTTYTTNNNCELVSAIGSSANLGVVTAKVTVNSTAGNFNGEPFIGRYYDIHPSQNANQSATITLYFSQADFDAYDTAVAALGNPDYPQINVAVPNLMITAFHGLPSAGTTGPNGMYDNSNKELIVPSGIVLNSAGFYEVTFTTPGFSGFFAHTTAAGTPLQITLGNLSAVNTGSTNRIDWNTLTEATGDVFEVERSRSGSAFENIGMVAAAGHAPGSYRFTDEHPYSGTNYYRLKLKSVNGAAEYSTVVAATVQEGDFRVVAYPNPTDDYLSLEVKGAGPQASVKLTDVTGHVLQHLPVQDGRSVIVMKHLAQGLYLVKYQDNNHNQTFKIYKN